MECVEHERLGGATLYIYVWINWNDITNLYSVQESWDVSKSSSWKLNKQNLLPASM